MEISFSRSSSHELGGFVVGLGPGVAEVAELMEDTSARDGHGVYCCMVFFTICIACYQTLYNL